MGGEGGPDVLGVVDGGAIEAREGGGGGEGGEVDGVGVEVVVLAGLEVGHVEGGAWEEGVGGWW